MIINIKKHLLKNYMYYIMWGILTAVICFCVFPVCSDTVIDYDSSYQYFLTQHNMSELFRLLPEDYSPPFYAVALKLFTMIFKPTLFVMRAFSIVSISGMIFLALFPIRKAFGKTTSIISALLFTCSSVNSIFLVKIRPNVFAYFFVTAVVIYSYIAYFFGEKYAYICFTVFSLLAMYTHNIAMLASLAIYIILIIFSLIQKNLKKAGNFFISGLICAVCYVPWLLVVFKQFGNVKSCYWKNSELNFSQLLDYTFEICFEDFDLNYIGDIIPVLLAVVIIILILKIIDVKKARELKKIRELFANLGNYVNSNKESYKKLVFIILELLISIGLYIVFSVCVYPLIAARYFYIFTGITLLLVALLLSKSRQKVLPIIISALIVSNSMICINNKRETLNESNFSDMIERIKTDHPDGKISFLHSHEWTLGIMMYYFPEAKHYVCDQTWCVLNTFDVFTTEVVEIGDVYNISDYSDDFYVFEGSFPDSEQLDSYFMNTDKYSINTVGIYSNPYIWTINEVKTK